MINEELGTLTEDELLAWDSYAAAALGGITASPNNAAKKAAEAADALLLQRRLRDPDA